MGVTNEIANQFKGMCLDAIKNDVFKIALFKQSLASIDKNTDTYTAGMAGEITGSGYTQGGITIPGAPHTVTVFDGQATVNGVTVTGMAYLQFNSNPQWSITTLTGVDAAIIYNASRGNKIVASFTFAPVTTSGGPLTVPMPTTKETALLWIS